MQFIHAQIFYYITKLTIKKKYKGHFLSNFQKVYYKPLKPIDLADKVLV